MERILEVNSLKKIYRNKRGIENISFDVDRGDIFGLLGPNGAGKTTTMKIITGLCKSDSGSVKIFGHDINASFEGAMEKVGCIIETPRMYEYMSAYRNLQQAARFYKEITDERIMEVINIVGLEKYKDEKVSKYSLGMKQRLGIALAIVSKPQLVILDEPANGLDIEGTIAIRDIIKKLASEEGIAFLISSHQIHEMELMCTKVGIISNGKLINVGRVDELLKENNSLENYFISHTNRKNDFTQ